MMIREIIRPLLIAAIVATAILLLNGCNDIQINSKWKTQQIIIDGSNTEWQGSTYIKDANAYINIINDEEYLYLGLMSPDRQLPMKILRNGFTIWFDAKGEGEKLFGIRFPIGMMKHGMPVKDQIPVQDEMPSMPGEYNENEMEKLSGIEFNEFEIVNGEEQTEATLLFGKNTEIEIKMNKPQERFFYEMKIPLHPKSNQYGIGADTSSTISIGFETAKIEMNKMKGGRGYETDTPPDRGDKESMKPSGGGRPGGGNPPQMKNANNEQFKIWINVKLSSGK